MTASQVPEARDLCSKQVSNTRNMCVVSLFAGWTVICVYKNPTKERMSLKTKRQVGGPSSARKRKGKFRRKSTQSRGSKPLVRSKEIRKSESDIPSTGTGGGMTLSWCAMSINCVFLFGHHYPDNITYSTQLNLWRMEHLTTANIFRMYAHCVTRTTCRNSGRNAVFGKSSNVQAAPQLRSKVSEPMFSPWPRQ